MPLLNFTKYDKYKLISLCIKAATGVIGASTILSKANPWISVSILALGAIANEVVNFIKDKETKDGKD